MGVNDLVNAQLSISDIIDMLARFDTPAEVMTTMFKTPPSQMHVFSSEEIGRYKLNRKGAATERADPHNSDRQPRGCTILDRKPNRGRLP